MADQEILVTVEDLIRLRELDGGETDLIKSVCNYFLKTIFQDFERIQKLNKQEKLFEAQDEASRLRASCLNLGLHPLAELFAATERNFVLWSEHDRREHLIRIEHCIQRSTLELGQVLENLL